MEPSWHLQKRISDWSHSRRTDQKCMDFSKSTFRKEFPEKFYSAHE